VSTIYSVGDCIKNVCRVESILEGGMGVVYICRILELDELPEQVRLKSSTTNKSVPELEMSKPKGGRYQVFKTFHRELLWHPSVADNFRREGLIWVTLLPHPNIVKALTIDLIGAHLHLMLEYVDGGSLRDRLSGRPLPLEESLSIALQFCIGMEFLFQSGPIIHLDIKPENILLTKMGKVKIADFGLAKALQSRNMTEFDVEHARASADETVAERHGIIAGTVPYMSPEQFSGGDLDVRSDIYGFGVVLYEMLTGRRPFHALAFADYERLHAEAKPVPPKEAAAVPDFISDIILTCLEKQPRQRFQTFTKLREAIESYCRGNGLASLVVEAPSLAAVEQSMTANDWNNRGYALAKLEDYEQSYECYRKSLNLEPDAMGANVNMGTGLMRLGRSEEALQYYEREVQLYPDFAIAYEPLANQYMEMGRGEDALIAMRKSAELDPQGIARWRALGLICLKLNREEEVHQIWEHIKSLLLTVPNYRNAMSVNNEVIILMNAGATDLALKMHRFGVDHYPESALIWYNFGITLHRLKMDDDALICYSRALELDDSLSFATLNRAMLFVKKGDIENALSDLEATIVADQDSVAGQLAASLLELAQLGGIEGLSVLSEIQASLKYIM
jgi:serine/threonine protein kinase